MLSDKLANPMEGVRRSDRPVCHTVALKPDALLISVGGLHLLPGGSADNLDTRKISKQMPTVMR